MMRTTNLAVLVLVSAASSAHASELYLAWQGVSGNSIELAEGDQAVVEIRYDLSDGDTLSGVGFGNELLADVEQVAVEANGDIGWTSNSADGASLGDGQQVLLFGSGDAVLDQPGEYLLGTQTVRLTSAAAGADLEIAIDVSGLTVLDDAGSFLTLVATDHVQSDSAGRVHLGVGSPGYTDTPGNTDVRAPLIIQISTGGPQPTPPPATGLCGMGVVMLMPLSLLGVAAHRIRRG